MPPSRSPSPGPRVEAPRRRSRSPRSPRRDDRRGYRDERDRRDRPRSPGRERSRSRDRNERPCSPRRDRSRAIYERSSSPRRDDRAEKPRSPRGEDRYAGLSKEEIAMRRDEEERANRPQERKPRVDKGFKWKEKRRDDNPTDEPKRLERGYRNRSPRRDIRDAPKGNSVEDKFGVSAKFGAAAAARASTSNYAPASVEDKFGPSKDTSKPPIRAPAAASTGTSDNEPMIIVYINDRLGTKAKIPCLASDPVRLFKAQVAARIGRQPHEILLKRQGERPFKDQLTLEDYGVSNGVQLDLEIDTGD